MKKYTINKKGISPLIATVLVIGFTIVLAGVVMQFLVPLFTASTEKSKADLALQNKCADFGTSLLIKSPTYSTDATKGLQFIVDNPTIGNIQYLLVKFYTNDGKVGSCKLFKGTGATDVEGIAIPAGGVVMFKILASGAAPLSGVATDVKLKKTEDLTAECNLMSAMPATEKVNKIEVSPAVFLSATKETKPCASAIIPATVY